MFEKDFSLENSLKTTKASYASQKESERSELTGKFIGKITTITFYPASEKRLKAFFKITPIDDKIPSQLASMEQITGRLIAMKFIFYFDIN